jgi:hypothetical protein
MTPEVIAAIASIGTFVVVGVTAIAALVQLRHIRAANQLTGLLEYTARWQSDEVQSGTLFVETQLPAKLRDPDYRASLLQINPDRRSHPELKVADWFEQMGSFIKYGLIAESQYMDLAQGYTRSMWEQLREVVALRRAAVANNSMYENFEYLAARSKMFNAGRNHTNYPRGTPRLMRDEEWQQLAAARTTTMPKEAQ